MEQTNLYFWRGFNKKMFKLRLSLIALFYGFSHWSIGTKKDKRYACLLYCISTTLSFKFLFMFSSPFQGSLKFFFTYEQWIYMYISIFFFSLFVSFRLKVCGLLPLPSSESVGRTLLIACYRSLSPTYPLQPLLQIGWSSSSCSSF